MSRVSFNVATASNPGAIAIVQVYGPGVADVVQRLAGKPIPIGRAVVADLGGIDEGLVALLRADWAQFMPHGGPRVVQRLYERLIELGAEHEDAPPARLSYPEARSDIEGDVLAALSRAASPAAIDLLLQQQAAWERFVAEETPRWEALEPATDPRRHLLDAPSVVLVGRPNVGKSTLTNLVLGRAASITADLPGTTRDWVAGLGELRTPIGQLTVRWFDTPGLREAPDPLEHRMMELAEGVIANANVLMAVRDAQTDWPQVPRGRRPDVWVINKSDLTQVPAQVDPQAIRISALTGTGLGQLAWAVARMLGLDRVEAQAPWTFSQPLGRMVAARNRAALVRYVRVRYVRCSDPAAQLH